MRKNENPVKQQTAFGVRDDEETMVAQLQRVGNHYLQQWDAS